MYDRIVIQNAYVICGGKIRFVPFFAVDWGITVGEIDAEQARNGTFTPLDIAGCYLARTTWLPRQPYSGRISGKETGKSFGAKASSRPLAKTEGPVH